MSKKEVKNVPNKKEVKTGESVSNVIKAFADSNTCPKAIKPYLLIAGPFVGAMLQAVEDSVPFFQACYLKYLEIEQKYLIPYKIHLLLPSFFGLVMCFFGGSYLTVIAAVEAFIMVAWESSKKFYSMLFEDFKKVVEVNAKDDAKDDDGDGIPDVLEITETQLVQRKFLLFVKTVDPERLSIVITGINAGLLAVIATLKVQFAKTITLGNAIGHSLEELARFYVLPVFEKLFPMEYKKWAWPIISYSCRAFAISLAWWLQRIISAFHSAIRGGLLFSRNIMVYLTEMKIYEIKAEESVLDEIVGYSLAALGLWFQVVFRFSVPFPLNIILFPLTILEYTLIWIVSNPTTK